MENNIIYCLPARLKLVQSLKERGYTVIGYAARESPTAKDDTNRMALLKAMCNRLKETSAMDYIFVSVCSNKARNPFNERDTNNNSKSLANLHVTGDTEGIFFIIESRSGFYFKSFFRCRNE